MAVSFRFLKLWESCVHLCVLHLCVHVNSSVWAPCSPLTASPHSEGQWSAEPCHEPVVIFLPLQKLLSSWWTIKRKRACCPSKPPSSTCMPSTPSTLSWWKWGRTLGSGLMWAWDKWERAGGHHLGDPSYSFRATLGTPGWPKSMTALGPCGTQET